MVYEETVNREIKEETGINLNIEKIEPFYCIKHYKKNFKNTQSNRLSQLYYFLIKTDEKVNVNNISYTEREKKGGFRLEYIQLDKLKENYAYCFWCKVDDTHSAVRFCTSWATKEEDVKALLDLL